MEPGSRKGFVRQHDALNATLRPPALLTCLASDIAAMLPRKFGTVGSEQDVDSGQWSPGREKRIHSDVANAWLSFRQASDCQ